MDNNATLAGVRPTAVSAGTLLLVGSAFALYQLTSLTLGPTPSRQFNLSLSVPAVELQEAVSPVSTSLDMAVGELARIATPKTMPAPSVMPVRSLVPARPVAPAALPAGPLATATASPAPVALPASATNYHDPDVRGLRLARGRRPGHRG